MKTESKDKFKEKKQSFKDSSYPPAENLKIISLSDNKTEELCYKLEKNLFQLEKDLDYFNFVLTEVQEIIKIS